MFLCLLLVCSLAGLGGLSVHMLKEQIPDTLRVRELGDLSLDLGALVTEEVTPEAENVSINAFSER